MSDPKPTKLPVRQYTFCAKTFLRSIRSSMLAKSEPTARRRMQSELWHRHAMRVKADELDLIGVEDIA